MMTFSYSAKSRDLTIKNNLILLISLFFYSHFINGQFYPGNDQKLLFVGQDLASVSNYRTNCTGCHNGHGEIAYLSFYTLEESSIFIDVNRSIYYGGIGMDNNGNRDTNNTNWGAGILNLWTAAERSPLVAIGLSIVEDAFNGLDGLQNIIDGNHDSKIVKMATFFNQFPSNIFYLRIGYEFDGNWNAYDQTKHIGAYQQIVDVLRANLSQDNVVYVWQSSTSPIDDILDGGQENINAYYPGDDYVDWMGLSWFLLPNENPTVGSFTPATQLALANELVSFAQSKGKPVMIAEASPQGYDLDAKTNCNISPVYDGTANQGCANKTATQIYQEWFDELFNFVKNNDDVRALCYINTDWDSEFIWSAANNNYASGYWGDSRVEIDADIRNSWIASIEDPANNFLQTEDSSTIINVLSIEDITLPTQGVFVYPNPGFDIINLQGVSSDFSYDLYTTTGRKVTEGVGDKVDVSHLSRGIYLLKSEGFVTRIIKQ